MTITSKLKFEDFNTIARNFTDFVDEYLFDDNRRLLEHYSELQNYYPSAADRNKKSFGWNVEKIKILFELLKLGNHDDAKKILSYMEHTRYGWQGGRYHLNNHCLRNDRHCKHNFKIDNTVEATEKAFRTIHKIFLDNNYGKTTTYLFGYCLAALFGSRLKQDKLRVPYFLQIACERNSNLYRLIHEIVDICDVNTDLIEHCGMDFDYGYCDYDYVTVFPTQYTEKALDDLVCNRDVPIIIDGYENEKFYGAMLRDVANIPAKREILGIKDRFNILPIFICPVIRSRFKNVFSMDLTGLDVSNEYLELIQKNKQRLASWALELVKESHKYFTPEHTMEQKILRKTEEERRFFDNINRHINRIRKEYRHYTELTLKDVANIGFLTYFLSKYMEVFKSSIRLTAGTEFTYKMSFGAHNPAKIVSAILNASIESLFKLHNSHSPTLLEKVTIDTNEPDPTKAKQAKRKGEEYAKNIVKYYQSYGVSIKILPKAEFKDERYVFHVKPLPGTDVKLLNRYADEVRRLLELEFFVPDVSRSSIKIIASEKPLKENSLIKILESPKFIESKMKIPYAVGYDMMGEMVIADIEEFPHLLIGGASGYGKSSALHSLLMSIVCKQKADKVKLLLLDFGASRLKLFANTPHLLKPVVTSKEIEKGRRYIAALIGEMEKRLEILEEINEKERDRELEKWTSIVCVIDEFPAFIRKLTAGKENKESHMLIIDLLERARKVKIHLILAAQDSTKGNIAIKMTNLAAAIAFRCTNWRDSHAILNAPDAADLYGKGSMYFKSGQHEGLLRLQGSYMEPEEIIDRLEGMEFDCGNKGEYYIEGLDEPKPPLDSGDGDVDLENSSFGDVHERLLAEIIMLALGQDMISNNQIKNKFEMGYDRANEFLGELEALGIVTKHREGTKLARVVKPKSIEDITAEVMEFLARHGYTENDITDALNKRLGKATKQGDSNV